MLAMPWAVPVRKVRQEDLEEIRRLAEQTDKITLTVRRAFLEAVERLSEKVDLDRIRDLLRAGDVAGALEAVTSEVIGSSLRSVGSVVTEAALTAGRVAAAAIPAPGQLDVVFDVTNPRTIEFLRNYEMGLIRELTAQARASVQQAIMDGVSAGRNPLHVARDVRAHIGLTERQTKAVLNYRRMLEDGDREALQRALRDRRFDSSVAAAVRGDRKLPPERIARMVERYQARYLKHRAETIARTEAIRAVNAGNLEAWRQAAAEGIVEADAIVRTWVYTADGRTRHAHRTIPALNPKGVGLDQPFQSELGPILYPGDPRAAAANTVNCRCASIIRYRPRAED